MIIVLTILAQFFFIALLILLCYKLKPWFGLAPLFVLIGSNQYFQTILFKSNMITVFGEYMISPGATILFSATLFTVLLIYIKEGVRPTRNLILAIIITNLAYSIYTRLVDFQMDLVGVADSQVSLARELYLINARSFIVGTVLLILDAFLIVILYEYLFARIKWLNLFSRLIIALLVILNFDALFFVIGSFWSSPRIENIVIGQVIGKSFVAVMFGIVLFIYLRYFDSDKTAETDTDVKGKEDIFSILTYQGRFEKLKTEKAISDEQLQNIITAKTAQLENTLRRHKIMASVRELQIDKFSTAEQANEFLIKVKEAFEVDACTIHLIKKEELEMLSSTGIEDSNKVFKMMFTFPYLKKMIAEKQSLCIEDTSKDSHIYSDFKKDPNIFNYKSCAGAPLISGDKVIGLLKLYSVHTIRSFSSTEMEHLQAVAKQLAHAIEANQLFEQNEKHKEVLVKQIIARKKIEEEKLTLLSRNQQMISTMLDGYVLSDEKGKILEVNTAYCDMIGYSHDELLNMTTHELEESKTPEEVEKIIGQAVEKSIQFETKHKRKDNSIIDVEVSLTMIVFDGKKIAAGFIKNITDRKNSEMQITSYNEQLKELTSHLFSIRDEERKRIGQEIHDDLGQQLTAIKMDVAWIDKKTPEADVAKSKLKNIISLLDGSNQSVRRILSELKPSILDEYGLIDALDWHNRQFTKNTGIPVVFKRQETEFRIAEDIATCIFRVVQESLTNIARYSEANKVVISVEIINENIIVIIEDNGIGFYTKSVLSKGSFGLLGMNERVQSLKGNFEIRSAPGKGTTVSISLPYRI